MELNALNGGRINHHKLIVNKSEKVYESIANYTLVWVICFLHVGNLGYLSHIHKKLLLVK